MIKNHIVNNFLTSKSTIMGNLVIELILDIKKRKIFFELWKQKNKDFITIWPRNFSKSTLIKFYAEYDWKQNINFVFNVKSWIYFPLFLFYQLVPLKPLMIFFFELNKGVLNLLFLSRHLKAYCKRVLFISLIRANSFLFVDFLKFILKELVFSFRNRSKFNMLKNKKSRILCLRLVSFMLRFRRVKLRSLFLIKLLRFSPAKDAYINVNSILTNMRYDFSRLSLIKRRFIKRRILLKKKLSNSIINVYVTPKLHNIFISASTFDNKLLLSKSCGSGASGKRKKQKTSTQAIEKTVRLAAKKLREITSKRRVNFVIGGSLRNKRLKSIIYFFIKEGFRVNSFIDRSLKVYGAVRPSKLRRV